MLGNAWQWIKAIFGQAARDRLHLCEDKLKYYKEERDAYEESCKSLKKELARVSAKLHKYEDQESYVNLEVCLISKDSLVTPAPRCPNCTKVMTQCGAWYSCAACKYDVHEKLINDAMKKYDDSKKYQI